MPCMKTLADNIPMHEKRQSLRVLYLHPAAAFGGASKSLIELFSGFPGEQVRATVVCPSGQAGVAQRLERGVARCHPRPHGQARLCHGGGDMGA